MSVRYYIFSLFLLLGAEITLGQSCETNGRKHYNFQDVQQVLDINNCNKCHYKGSAQSKWHYESYDNITKSFGCNERLIIPGRPGESLLIDKLNGGPTSCGNAMPLGNNKISNQDLIILESWITLGAPEYCIDEYDKIKSIFQSNQCYNCHNSANSWSFESFNTIFDKPSSSICEGEEIVKYEAENSILYKKLSGLSGCGEISIDHSKILTNNEVSKVRDWINAGAPESAKALPVSLSEFRTSNMNDEKVLLYWNSSVEINTEYFEVQHSTDGVHFNKVEQIQSKGNNNAGNQYTFIFSDPYLGYNYFRLKIVDYDQSFSYSATRVEQLSNSNEIFRVLPNPVLKDQDCFVEWYPTDGREKVRLLLVNINGQLVKQFILNNGINQLDYSGLKSGVYYISIEDYYSRRQLRKVVILDY